MNWKLVGAAFASVFLAELGDKTQLATFALAASGNDRTAVFVGSAAALVCTSLIAVLVGGTLGKFVPVVWLERAGGLLMLGIGAWTLWKSFAA